MISGIGLLVHWQKLSYMITLEYMSTIYKGVRGRICRNIITPDRKLQHSFGRWERSRGWHRNGSQKKSVPESQIFPVWRAGDIIRVWTFWKSCRRTWQGDWGKSHVRRKMQKAWRWNLEIIRITTWNCAVPPIPEWVHIRRRHCLNSTFHLQRTVKRFLFQEGNLPGGRYPLGDHHQSTQIRAGTPRDRWYGSCIPGASGVIQLLERNYDKNVKCVLKAEWVW